MFYNSERYKVSYLPIPKCGSSSIQHALMSDEGSKSETPKYQSFTVIRHPEGRILSGYHELIKRGTFDGSLYEMFLKITNDGFFDPHIVPQVDFLKGAKINRFFKFPNFSGIEQWVGDGIEIPHRNKSERQIDNWHKKSLELLYTLYKKDIKLWRTCQV